MNHIITQKFLRNKKFEEDSNALPYSKVSLGITLMVGPCLTSSTLSSELKKKMIAMIKTLLPEFSINQLKVTLLSERSFSRFSLPFRRR